MTDDPLTHVIPPSAVAMIRVLNGPLRGCEFELQAGTSTFIVSDEAAWPKDGYPAEFPPNVIYVPSQTGKAASTNFELVIEDCGAAGFEVRELHDDATVSTHGRFNSVMQVGSLLFAVRLHDTEWSPDVIAGRRECASRQPPPAKSMARPSLLLMTVVLICVLAVAAMLWYASAASPQGNTASVARQLGLDVERTPVLGSSNGRVYIMAANENDRSWIRQGVMRSGVGDKVSVLTADTENERIERWMERAFPGVAYFRLHLDEPSAPQLWISRERTTLPDAEEAALTQALLERLPYARRVDLVRMPDRRATSEAEAGIVEQAVPYFRTDGKDGVTFEVCAQLGDAQIRRMRVFAERYRERWGAGYVHLVVDLKDDVLKGQSYRYGAQGYTKPVPNEWDFVGLTQ